MRRLAFSLLLLSATLAFCQASADFDNQAAGNWEPLSQREKTCVVSGILLGGSYIARFYDYVSHPGDGHPMVIDDYRHMFGVHTAFLVAVVERAYTIPLFRKVPFVSIVMRWEDYVRVMEEKYGYRF